MEPVGESNLAKRAIAVAPLSTVTARRVCIISRGGLGDIVQTVPLARALLHRFPSAHVTWATRPEWAALVVSAGLADQALSISEHSTSKRLSLLAARKLHEPYPFDLIVDLGGDGWASEIAQRIDAPARIGLWSRRCRDLPLTFVIDDRSLSCSLEDRFWLIAEALGVGAMERCRSIRVTSKEEQKVRSWLEGFQRPRLGIFLNRESTHGSWSAAQYADVIDGSLSTRGTCLLIGDMQEEELGSEITDRLRCSYLNLCGVASVVDLAAILAEVDVVVAGPEYAHLAAAAGSPTVTTLLCTEPDEAAPQGRGHAVIRVDHPCKRGIWRPAPHTCLARLGPHQLLKKIRFSLSETVSSPSTARRAA